MTNPEKNEKGRYVPVSELVTTFADIYALLKNADEATRLKALELIENAMQTGTFSADTNPTQPQGPPQNSASGNKP